MEGTDENGLGIVRLYDDFPETEVPRLKTQGQPNGDPVAASHFKKLICFMLTGLLGQNCEGKVAR